MRDRCIRAGDSILTGEYVRTVTDKVKCKECLWFGHKPDALSAINPFNKLEIIYGCPKCKTPEALQPACCEDGCWSYTTCGQPHRDGYRHTCGTHYRYDEKQKQKQRKKL